MAFGLQITRPGQPISEEEWFAATLDDKSLFKVPEDPHLLNFGDADGPEVRWKNGGIIAPVAETALEAKLQAMALFLGAELRRTDGTPTLP